MSQISITPPAAQTLTNSQKEFNRLSKKISDLRDSIEGFENFVPVLINKEATELRPLLLQIEQVFADTILLLDRMYDHTLFKAKDRKKIKLLIVEQLSERMGDLSDELVAIYNKYAETDYHEEMEEANNFQSALARQMLSQIYGIDVPDDTDLSSSEKIQEFMEQYSAQQETKDFEKKQAKTHIERPKTAKQIEKEQKQAEKKAKLAEEERKISKSVREVYMDLVKTFHPDLEKDPTEQARKTTIMQRVTAAYESNDLLVLLKLQLEFERIDEEHLTTVAEERLLLFNKLLRTQANDLQQDLDDIKKRFSLTAHRPPHLIKTPAIIEYWFNQSIKEAKKAVQASKKQLI